MFETLINYFINNWNEIFFRILEHLKLTLISASLSIVVGVPLGILITYIKPLKKPILGLANVIQSIPSLAILGFLIPLLGIGTTPAIFMVLIYSLLPIIKNTSTGLDNINKDTIESAKGIGMTNFEILTIVKIPLALPIIMTGIRISAVTSVGLVTLAAFIGAGGLGYLVYSGIRTVNNLQILSGAIPACILALLIDFFVGTIEKFIVPLNFSDEIKNVNNNTIKSYKTKKIIAIFSSILLIIIIFITTIIPKKQVERKIIIGSKDYTEQVILGYIYKELIEKNTDIEVELKQNLASNVVFNAITSGEIDFYIEYTGTVYNNILQMKEAKSSDEIYEFSKKTLKEKYNLDILAPLGFNNTYTLSMSKDIAEKNNIKTYSDLAKIGDKLIFGGGFEILNRPDGIPNLTKVYGFNFKELLAIDGTPRYVALINNEIQVTDAYSTDGMLKKYDLAVLEDDKNFFPPYHSIPIIRNEFLNNYPELTETLSKLDDSISDDVMRELNYKVDVLNLNPEEVAKEFIGSNF